MMDEDVDAVKRPVPQLDVLVRPGFTAALLLLGVCVFHILLNRLGHLERAGHRRFSLLQDRGVDREAGVSDGSGGQDRPARRTERLVGQSGDRPQRQDHRA
ncbi:hypothetical protein CGRA01v4_12927 [Colletotrichum graminicola]|nr:hypothetical protein CGRA01v4_12927 [Colletotrichum graminicola]